MAPNAPKTRTLEILLVEDNPADIRLTQEALRLCGLQHVLSIARDGEQALAMLRQEGEYGGQSKPDIVLLDLNLPRKDGYEVLSEMKADPRTAQIPVLVLSTSGAERDVVDCYRRHANCYLQKPVNFEDFASLVRSIQEFWLNRVLLPPHIPGKSFDGANASG